MVPFLRPRRKFRIIAPRVGSLTLVLCGCLALRAYQQPVAPVAPPESPSPGAQGTPSTQTVKLPTATAEASIVVLHDGQEVVLRNIDPIASNKSRPDDIVRFEVIRGITSDGAVVIPEHAIAVGKVLSAEHAKMFHHGAKLAVSIESVQLTNGECARLRAVKSRKERNFGWQDVGAAAAIAATLYYMPLAPVYLLSKGDEVNIPPGTRFTAFVDADVTLDRASLGAAAPTPEVKSDVATIFIYRGNQDKAPGTVLPVSCGRVYLAGLTDEVYIRFNVAPGRYWFYANVPEAKLSASQQQAQMVALDAIAGNNYYLEVAFVPAKWKTLTSTIRQTDESVGAEEVFKAALRESTSLPQSGSKEFAKLSAKPKGVKSN